MSRQSTIWHGCYGGSWNGIITPDAFAHPAKFAPGLIQRIYQHMLERGYLAAGDSVVDPFGGVGLGGYHAMLYGLHFTGVELEPRFCDMARGLDCPGFSKDDWRRFSHRIGRVNYRTTPGGSFHFCPSCHAALGAPPADRVVPTRPAHRYEGNIDKWRHDLRMLNGRLGTARLLQGDSRMLAAIVGAAGGVVSSPPYEASVSEKQSGGGRGIDMSKFSNPGKHVPGKNAIGSNMAADFSYGQTPGQLGSMPSGDFSAAVGSPPYATGERGHPSLGSVNKDSWGHDGRDIAARRGVDAEYGTTPGQLADMTEGRFTAAVSSPPYADAIDGSGEGPGARHDHKHHNADTAERLSSDNGYGSTPGNVGNDSGDDFWAAARLIVEQTYAVLKPGGYVAWVCKDFVRKAQRVPFSDQWERLCAAVGFELVERIKAMLVEEHGDQMDIFGGATARRKEKKSFFRRLAEKKGSPRIDWEDVVIMRKPL